MADPTVADQVTIVSTFISSLPVIIGGALAILGGVVSTFLSSNIELKRDRASLKRAKLEELLEEANNVEHWLDEYKNKQLTLADKYIGKNPVSKVEYISALYFEELDAEVSSLKMASASYFDLIARSHGGLVKTGVIPDFFMGEYKEKYMTLIGAISSIQTKAAELAKSL